MVGNATIQFSFLRVREWRHRISLHDAVPERLYQLDLFVHTELFGLIKKLSIHGAKYWSACRHRKGQRARV